MKSLHLWNNSLLIVVFSIVFLLVTFTLPPCSIAETKELKTLFDQGVQLWKLGDYKGAISVFDNVLRNKPDHRLSLIYKGITLSVFRERQEESKKYFDKATDINAGKSEDAYSYLAKGQLYVIEGKIEAGVEALTKAIEMNPKLEEAYNGRGGLYLAKSYFDKAMNDFNKAIELNPKYAGAYTNRGLAYRGKGNSDAAIKDYSKAIELNPKFHEAYHNRGAAYLYKNDLDAAISDFTRSIEEQNPRPDDSYVNRGLCYRKKNNLDAAIKDYNKVIEINPQNVAAYNNRGVAYANKNEYKFARRDWEKTVELDPNGPQGAMAKRNLERLKGMGY